jgi:hypothetical protein
MGYVYEAQKSWLFSDEGQREFLKVRDHVAKLIQLAGACTVGKAMSVMDGDSWERLACVDRLVELGEVVYADREGERATQDRPLIRKR